MVMNKYTVLIFAGLSLFASAVMAEVTLGSAQDLQGSWKLDHTKKSLTSLDEIKREDTWEFKGDKVTILHIPRDGTYYDQLPVVFQVENAKLKIALLGRSDKFDEFSLVEKTDKTMTLKGKFGDVYYFVKK